MHISQAPNRQVIFGSASGVVLTPATPAANGIGAAAAVSPDDGYVRIRLQNTDPTNSATVQLLGYDDYYSPSVEVQPRYILVYTNANGVETTSVAPAVASGPITVGPQTAVLVYVQDTLDHLNVRVTSLTGAWTTGGLLAVATSAVL